MERVNTSYKTIMPHPPYLDRYEKMTRGDSINILGVPSYDNSGPVIVHDYCFAKDLDEGKIINYFSLPSIDELVSFGSFPQRIAVVMGEGRGGYGDIMEAISLSKILSSDLPDSIVDLILPRDLKTYTDAKRFLDDIDFGIRTVDHRDAFDDSRPYPFAIYPSSGRSVSGRFPAEVSILLKETGSNCHTLLEASTRYRDNTEATGGKTLLISTDFEDQRYNCGIVPPLAKSYPDQEPIRSIDLSHDVQRVIAYLGSGSRAEPTTRMDQYIDLLRKHWTTEPLKVVVPGSSFGSVCFNNWPGIEYETIGQINCKQMNWLYANHISRKIPSLTCGSMSWLEAMQYRVPSFYAVEPWKKGNLIYLDKVIRDIGGISLDEDGNARTAYSSIYEYESRGLTDVNENGPCPSSSIIAFKPKDNDGQSRFVDSLTSGLYENLQQNSKKLINSLFGWYGLIRNHPESLKNMY